MEVVPEAVGPGLAQPATIAAEDSHEAGTTGGCHMAGTTGTAPATA